MKDRQRLGKKKKAQKDKQPYTIRHKKIKHRATQIMIQLLSSAESCFKNRSKSISIVDNPWTDLSILKEVMVHFLAYRSQALVSINTSLLSILTNIY
jgi:hypothetical protein